MKTENLIQELIHELKPVKRINSTSKRLIHFVAIATFCFLGALSIFGIREDIREAISNPAFFFQAIILFILAVLSALSALILSVPGEERSSRVRWIPILVFFLWGGTLVWLLTENQGSVGHGLNCIRDIVVFGAVPGIVLMIMVRKAAALTAGWNGALLLMSVAALGALGAQFVCHNDSPSHLLLWHLIPVAMAGLIGVFLGKWILALKGRSKKL